MKKKSYGWCYDSKGNLKEVHPPTNEKGKVMKKHSKTKTGSLLGGVGFSMNYPENLNRILNTLKSM